MAQNILIIQSESQIFEQSKLKYLEYSLKSCILPNEDILQAIAKSLKEISHEKQYLKLNLPNLVSDQVNVNGQEIEWLLSQACNRFNKLVSLELNFDAWGSLFRVFTYIHNPIIQCKGTLKQLIIKGNNKSLSPSISNKALKNLSLLLENLTLLTYLHLELGDTSSDQIKQIQDDGFKAFAVGLSHIKNLKYLHLNLSAWHSSFRSKIKDARNLFKILVDAIFDNRKLEILYLNFSWWEQMNFQCIGDFSEGLMTVSQSLKQLSLNFHRFSYYNNSYDVQAIQQLALAFSQLKISSLQLDMFEIGAYRSQCTYIFNKQKDNRLENMVQSLQQINNLLYLDLKIKEYVDSYGMYIIKKYLGNMKFLAHLKIDMNVPYDEKQRYLSSLIKLYQAKQQIVYSGYKLLKNKCQRKFRKEILFELVQIMI